MEFECISRPALESSTALKPSAVAELAKWANNQRTYGNAFKKPASERSQAEKTYAGRTTERRVALLDGIGFLD